MRLDTFPVQPAPGIDVDFASCERAVVAVMEKAKKQILECSAALGGLEAYHDAPACTKLRYRIRDALADMRQALGELELLHDQCSTSGTVERVGGLLRQARQEYKDLFAHGRAAIKGSKDRGDAVARRLLLEGTRGEDDELGLGMAREGARGRDALREAENQTQVLRRIRLQIAGEIERQEAAGVALGDSNQVLQKAGAEFKRQHPLLRTSHALLRALRRQEVIDFVILWTAISIFALAVLFVLHKRVAFFTPDALKGLLPASLAMALVRAARYLGSLVKRMGLEPLFRALADVFRRLAQGTGIAGPAPPASAHSVALHGAH